MTPSTPAATSEPPKSTFYPADDKRIEYQGYWENWPGSPAYELLRVARPGAFLTIQFEGSKLDWVGYTGSMWGKAWVILDGGEPVLVDLSEPRGFVIWSTGVLQHGVHTVRIYVDEPPNDGAGKSTLVNVGGFEIEGELLGNIDGSQFETPEWNVPNQEPEEPQPLHLYNRGSSIDGDKERELQQK